jgi:hypothetical protein
MIEDSEGESRSVLLPFVSGVCWLDGNGVLFFVGVTLMLPFRMVDAGVTVGEADSGIFEGEVRGVNGCEDIRACPGITPALRAKSVSSSPQFRSSSAKKGGPARGRVLVGALFTFGVDGCCCRDATKPYIHTIVVSYHRQVNYLKTNLL